MIKFLSVVFSIIILSACTTSKKATTNYQVMQEGKTKIPKGIINRSLIENDTAFAWFKQGMGLGMADQSAVSAFKDKSKSFSMVVFGGTWCPDTRNLLPKFYRVVDQSGYPDKKITLIGVDRAKTAPDDLHKKYGITNVPTFIVIKDGKEVGRVVEYGKTGNMEKELGDIVRAL